MTTRLLRWHHARPATVIANSASVAADATRALANGTRVVTVRNGVDLDRFSLGGARSNLDAICGLPQAPANTVRVGLVATLARWKGHATFLNAIARLPEKLRLPVVYAAIEGLDYASIAEMLGIPIGTVKTHVFRGKQLLKDDILRRQGHTHGS